MFEKTDRSTADFFAAVKNSRVALAAVEEYQESLAQQAKSIIQRSLEGSSVDWTTVWTEGAKGTEDYLGGEFSRRKSMYCVKY